MKILIVEDEALIAMSIEAILEDNGYDVVEIADDEASALEAAKRHNPELALVDMRLAGGDSGLSVARKLNAMRVGVVFATGNCPGAAIQKLAIGCLHKPLSDDQIIAGVSVADAKRRGAANPPPPPPGMHLFD